MASNPYAVGTTFPSIKEARDILLQYTVEQSLSYKIVKSDASRYSLACLSKECPFHLHVNYSKRKKAVVVSVYRPHTCSPETHRDWKMSRSMRYLVPRLSGAYNNSNDPLKPRQIQASEILKGTPLKYHQAWRARKHLELLNKERQNSTPGSDDIPMERRKKRVLVGYGIDVDAVSNCLPISRINTWVDRLLNLWDKYNIKATWFAPAHTVESFPNQLAKVRDAGHEIGLHGYTHEYVSDLSLQEQRTILERSIEILTKFTGSKPLGFTAPGWKTSKELIPLLEEYGIMYDHSFMHHDVQPYFAPDSSAEWIETNLNQPAELWMRPMTKIRPSTVVEIPANWHLDDWPPLQPVPGRPASQGFVDTHVVEKLWMEQFDFAYREYDEFIFPMSIHPQVSGKPQVILMHERIIEYINKHEGVEWMTFGEMAKEFREGKISGVTIEGGV
ncbi:hypothetical protein FQN51_008843 [Onygenales sp. PD_10]|nr:hypothetical protein FQN51_008843 [Onygenales sp. PD_10]